jgi:hypothetical protein
VKAKRAMIARGTNLDNPNVSPRIRDKSALSFAMKGCWAKLLRVVAATDITKIVKNIGCCLMAPRAGDQKLSPVTKTNARLGSWDKRGEE